MKKTKAPVPAALPEVIRLLSFYQPYGTAVMRKLKRIETRGFQTDYRGPIAIHTTLKIFRSRDYSAAFVKQMQADGLFRDHLEGKLPYGLILGTVELLDIKPVEEVRKKLDPRELMYGDYRDGRFAWILGEVQTCANPIHFKGVQGIIEIRSALLRAGEAG